MYVPDYKEKLCFHHAITPFLKIWLISQSKDDICRLRCYVTASGNEESFNQSPDVRECSCSSMDVNVSINVNMNMNIKMIKMNMDEIYSCAKRGTNKIQLDVCWSLKFLFTFNFTFTFMFTFGFFEWTWTCAHIRTLVGGLLHHSYILWLKDSSRLLQSHWLWLKDSSLIQSFWYYSKEVPYKNLRPHKE